MPDVISPNPRACAFLLNFAYNMVKIVPEQLALTYYHKFIKIFLYGNTFFVHTQVEKARSSENLINLVDNVLTEFVICRSREHTGIYSHPFVMTGGKVKLRDNLKSH